MKISTTCMEVTPFLFRPPSRLTSDRQKKRTLARRVQPHYSVIIQTMVLKKVRFEPTVVMETDLRYPLPLSGSADCLSLLGKKSPINGHVLKTEIIKNLVSKTDRDVESGVWLICVNWIVWPGWLLYGFLSSAYILQRHGEACQLVGKFIRSHARLG